MAEALHFNNKNKYVLSAIDRHLVDLWLKVPLFLNFDMLVFSHRIDTIVIMAENPNLLYQLKEDFQPQIENLGDDG